MASASVRISRKAAQASLLALEFASDRGVSWSFAIAALKSALAAGPRRSVVARRKVTAKKKRTKAQETKEVRAAVMVRAGGECESGLSIHSGNLEMDHFWGRGKAPQTVANCWMLCGRCHRQKTDNAPNRDQWLVRFSSHAAVWGYQAEAERANTLAAALLGIDAASSLQGRGETR